MHTTLGRKQLDAAARAKVLEMGEKGLKGVYKVLEKVQDAGSRVRGS